MDSKMYSPVVTMCWSITEVNRNLSDRKPTAEYSVKYLKDACIKLGNMLIEIDKANPGEEIKIVDKSGRTRSFSLVEVAKMLSDVKKILELNLIDHIDRWARSHIA